MNVTKKDLVYCLAKEYVSQYKQNEGIYNALKEFNIYIDIERPREESYIERELEKINEFLVQDLLDFAEYGEVKYEIEGEVETVTSIKEIVNIYVN